MATLIFIMLGKRLDMFRKALGIAFACTLAAGADVILNTDYNTDRETWNAAAKTVVYTGTLGSLKRMKDDVKEVASGFDCGLSVDGFNDIKIGDMIEAYQIVEIKRKL